MSISGRKLEFWEMALIGAEKKGSFKTGNPI